MLTFVLLLWLAQAPAQPMMTDAVSHFVVFGGDTNSNPPILFGGKTYSEMDRCSAIAVRRILYSSPTGAKDYVTKTATIEYLRPGKVGDSLVVYAKVVETGVTSITVDVVVEKEVGGLGIAHEPICKGRFVFAAFDRTTEKAIPHGIKLK